MLEKSSITVACSRWEEPFGRISIEAASRGSAVILSNMGGLKETVSDAILMNELNHKVLYKNILGCINMFNTIAGENHIYIENIKAFNSMNDFEIY